LSKPIVRRTALATGLISTALAFGACGGDEEDSSTQASAAADLSAIKGYLTDHTAQLRESVTAMNEEAKRYHQLAESVGFDYERLLAEHRDEVAGVLERSKRTFVKANPSYEEMEGIVAGVPRLAQYDVDIDAGADASDPENAVSFNLELPGGETIKQPGNLFFVTETALFGTNPDFLATEVKGDIDGNGRVDFGEGLPDAEIYLAATDEFVEQASSLDQDAQEFEPTPSDAFTAITVMTPTMSEYFEAWKNSRFIAGGKATELGCSS
jgi:hypothetical protein